MNEEKFQTEKNIKPYYRDEFSLGVDRLSLSEAAACERVPRHIHRVLRCAVVWGNCELPSSYSYEEIQMPGPFVVFLL